LAILLSQPTRPVEDIVFLPQSIRDEFAAAGTVASAIGQQDRIALIEKHGCVTRASLARIADPVKHDHTVSIGDLGSSEPTVKLDAIERANRCRGPSPAGRNRGRYASNVKRELAEDRQRRNVACECQANQRRRYRKEP